MTLCLLVRHAAHELVDRALVGRNDSVGLSEAGRAQAADLRRRLSPFPIAFVQTSPTRRARETAAAIAGDGDLSVEFSSALDEVDFGGWTGRTFEELAREPEWVHWNVQRAAGRPPGGETMGEAQDRIVAHLRWLQMRRPRGAVVLVTHAEIIRAAVLHAMSLPLDEWSRIHVPPASVTRLEMRSRTHMLVSLNAGRAAA